MSAAGAVPAIVDTPEEGEALPLPPLLVRRPLEALLDEHGLGSGPIEAREIGQGHSNVTFLIRRDSFRAVLRRPPRPPYAPSAHDVLREARILRALAPTAVPVPEVLLVCEEAATLGVPFYVMSEVEGDVLTSDVPALLDDAEGRTGIAHRMVDTLADLHALDIGQLDLATLGRTEGYLDRQLRRFRRIWDRHRTRELPVVDEVAAWLVAERPAISEVTLVHGDFRPANVMLARRTPATIAGLLDWELATLGDPLCDVGWLLSTWPEEGDAVGTLLSEAAGIGRGGFPDRAMLAQRYAERTGRSVADMAWYTAFAFWRAAVGLESFYERALAGTTSDPFIHRLGGGVPELAARARSAVTAAQ